MTVFKHVTRINVSLWGERVGTIVEAPQRGVYAFRYEKKFLQSGIRISRRTIHGVRKPECISCP